MPIRSQFTSDLRVPLRNAALAGAAVALITLLIPNTYVSEARILPADSRGSGGLGQMAAAAAAVGIAVPGQDSSDAAFVDIVNSHWMWRKLLQEKYRFSTRFFYFGPWRERDETLYEYLDVKNMDRAMKKMKEVLTVKRDLKTKLLTLSAETQSPELSQLVVRKAVGILEDFIQVKSRTRGGNKAVFTAERLKEAQESYTLAERESMVFLNDHRNFATSNEPAVRMKGTRLENTLKLRQQVVTTLTLNSEQALLEEKNDMPILNLLDEGDVPIDKSYPPRSIIVLMAMLLVAGGSWGWTHRERLKTYLLSGSEEA